MTTPGVRVHESLAARVLLGAGARHEIPAEVQRLGLSRVLLVATRSAAGAAAELAEALGPALAARFDGPVVHTPVAVTDEARAIAVRAGADGVIALGGGSAIGLGKALVARTGLPQLAVPTTYAGSEVTPVLGETEGGVKTTRRDAALAPGTVVYDPELTLSMPVELTVTSALNALAHSIEALWAPDATLLTDGLATESVAAMLGALPEVLAAPSAVPGRTRLQQGAWLAGLCLAGTRMGLHHQLAHVLGGAFDLPHAPLHALLLPHVTAFNLPAAPDAADRLARAAGADPVGVLTRLAGSSGAATTLRELGVARDRLPEMAERVVAHPYPNPRAFDVADITALLERAWGDSAS